MRQMGMFIVLLVMALVAMIAHVPTQVGASVGVTTEHLALPPPAVALDVFCKNEDNLTRQLSEDTAGTVPACDRQRAW